MSLDGFIAGPKDSGFDLLFKWYGAGDVEVPMPDSTAEVPASQFRRRPPSSCGRRWRAGARSSSGGTCTT